MGNKKTKPKIINDSSNFITQSVNEDKTLSEENIEFLIDRTGFDREEIINWHESFMKECPNGYLDKKTLIKTFANIYPNGKPDRLCRNLLNALDNDGNHRVDFIEYMIGISHTHSSDIRKKLELTFKIYDQNNDGRVNCKEIEKMIISILELNGIKDRSGVNNPKYKASNILRKFNKDQNSSLNKDEFINGCLSDNNLIDLLAEYRI